jgi:serine/threonine protein kinase
MDLIEGLTLREILDKRAGSWLHSDEVEQITEKLVSALSETHKLGVCHLDLSPDNVMLDAKGNPILIDFGAARQSLDMTHSFAFKPRYAPPELMFEGDVGPETDLFELSMMIYEMLTGKLPPSANQRLGMNGNDWTPTGVSEAWKSLLAVGLNLEQKDRPKDILYWWENFYKYSKNNSGRPKMIIGEIKPSKPKMVIGRRVSRHKP